MDSVANWPNIRPQNSKGAAKNMCGRKNLRPSFSTIFIKRAEFSKVYFSSLVLSSILLFLLKCAQKSVVLEQDFFSQRPNFVPDWLESSFKSWQHCRGNILEEAHAFFAVVLVGQSLRPTLINCHFYTFHMMRNSGRFFCRRLSWLQPLPLPVCPPSLPLPEPFFSVCKLTGGVG
jgi:hypothetical protein